MPLEEGSSAGASQRHLRHLKSIKFSYRTPSLLLFETYLRDALSILNDMLALIADISSESVNASTLVVRSDEAAIQALQLLQLEKVAFPALVPALTSSQKDPVKPMSHVHEYSVMSAIP